MIKVLQINVVANFGSTGRIAEEIGLRSQEQGWESYIAFGRKESLSKSNLIKIGCNKDVYYHVLKTRLFDRHGFGSKKATEILVERIEILKPDILHLHNLHGYYINIRVLFDYLSKVDIPVVWTLHDCWAFTGHCTYFDSVGCNKWETGCHNCPQRLSYPNSWGFDASKKNYKQKQELFNSLSNLTIVPVSEWLAELVSRSFLRYYPIKVIRNGVDLKQFTPKNPNDIRNRLNLQDKLVILGVANGWTKRKGLSDFIELSERLECNSKIVLIGLNKKQIKELPQNIIGVERTESVGELAEFYSLADIFINPSVEESFGLVTIEAMACGTPVVVYNATASPELVSPETGFIVSKGDIAGLVKCIKTIKEKGKESYAKACLKRVKKHYNQYDRSMDYIDLYKELT
jgi:putative colanic acid biosynthesis glycosyltransferase